MTTKHRSRIWIAVAALALVVLACTCSLGGGGTPAPSPVPASPVPLPITQAAPTKPPIVAGTGELQVINTNAVQYESGGWRLLGEVSNGTDSAVNSVTLAMEWFDSAGASLGKDTGYLLTTNIAPGETAPFAYYIFDSGVPLASFTAAVSEFTSSQNFQRAQLDLKDSKFFVDGFGNFHCVGELVNNTGQPVDIAGLAAAMFDTQNVLFSANSYWAVTRHLEPGESTPFRISPDGVSGAQAADYTCSIYTDAQFAEPAAPNVIVFKDTNNDGNSGNDIYYYADSYGAPHLVGEVLNNGAEPMSVQLVAGLYDANGSAVDADYASVPLSLNPGEAAPFDFTTFLSSEYRPEAANFTVQVDMYWTYPAFSESVPLRTEQMTSSVDNGTFSVEVDVVNDQTFNVDYAYVMATVTDSTGRVVAYNYTTTNAIAANGREHASLTVYGDPTLEPPSLMVNVFAQANKP